MPLVGLSLRDLEYLVAVAECRHFGRAAAHCAVSQPSLSAQIRKLERFLGVQVFERLPGRVAVTPRGEAVLAQAEVVLREARALVEAARGPLCRMAGRFRIGAIPTVGPYLLPLALQPLRQRFPDIEITFVEGRTDELMAALRHGAVDAVVACAPEDSDDLSVHALFLEPFLLVHRPEQPPCWPMTGRNEPILMLEEGHCLRDQALSACGLGACIAGRCAAGIEMLRHMVAAGEGVSLIPALAARALGTLEGRIAYTPLAEAEITRSVVIACRASDPRAEHLPAIAHLMYVAAAMPDPGTHTPH